MASTIILIYTIPIFFTTKNPTRPSKQIINNIICEDLHNVIAVVVFDSQMGILSQF